MSKSRVLVFVVTFMSFIDYSYLSKTVVLPNITDQNYGEYLRNIECTILKEDQFLRVKSNYENEMKIEYDKPEYKDLIREKRESYYEQKKLKKGEKTYTSEVETMHDDNPLLTLDQQAKEELDFLNSLGSLSDENGRIKTLYLSTVYGSNEHIIHAQKNSIDSVWLHLLQMPDPMFGEKYISYAFRVINSQKMPLPKEEIPVFYGDGHLYLFDEFDIWPELNAVFVMYYMFNCPLEETPHFDESHIVADHPTPSTIITI